MSPRSRTGLIASRLVGGALLLAMLPAGTVRAQAPTDGMPFESIVDSSSYLGQTPFRAWHRTRGYGEETAETALGTHWATPTAGGIGFIDGQLRVGNTDQDFSLNFGGGFRWRNDDYFTNSPRILGVSFWYDGEDTELNNYFNQLGVSFERLGPLVDLRFNANFPLEEIKQGDNVELTGDTVFVGSGLAQSTIAEADASLRTVDFEIAPRLFNLNAWLYAGGYQMDGEDVSEFGEKGGVRGYLMNDLVLDVGVNDDDLFGTTTVVQIIWTPGRVTADPSSWVHSIDDRMREQVYRNPYVAVTRTQVMGSQELTDNEGNPFDIVHVDRDAPDGGDGSFENPLNNLNDIDDNSEVGDIILVHADPAATNIFANQSATLQDAQRFLGEGGGEDHFVITAQSGEIALPETFAGAGTATRPEIQAAAGDDAVILAGGTDSVSTLAEIEVSNFDITAGARGIASPMGVGGVNINRVVISDTTSHGIELTPLQETLANGSDQIRFTPTIDDVTFRRVGDNDMQINANIPAVDPATPVVEDINISNIDSMDGEGIGLNLINTKDVVNVADFTWDGNTTGLGGIRTQDAQDNLVADDVMIREGAATAFGIALVNGAAGSSHVFTDTTITNTGGDSIVADGGFAAMTFTGQVTQSNNASAVSVLNGHDALLTFNESTAGAGVILASNGDGLQFNNADGTYTFNDGVRLTGGDAGIDITNGSDATFSLLDPTNEITNPTGVALLIDGSEATFTYNGAITADNNRPVELTDNTGGSVTINSTVEGNDEGILVSGNSGGTFRFSGQTTMNTGANDAVQILNNTGGSIRFDNLDVTTTAGTGFLVSNVALPGMTIEVTGTENTITTTTGVGLNLNNVNVGTNGVAFASVNVSNGATNGVVLNNVTGGAVTIGAGAAAPGGGGTMSTADEAVLITNAANVTLNRLSITGTGAGDNGIEIVHDNAANSTVSVTNTVISGTGGAGILYDRSASATSRLTLNGNTISATGAEGIAIDITGSSDANLTINNNTVANASNNQALLITTSGGTAKTVRLLADGNTMSNSDDDERTIDIQILGSVSFNATVTDNFLTNADPAAGARAFEMNTNSLTAVARLNLDNNTASSTNANDYLLDNVSGTFSLQNQATVNTRNVGGVEQNNITPDAGPIPQPQ